MTYFPQIVEARHVKGFVVSTRFSDGTEKKIDVSQWFKGPVFDPLKTPRCSKNSLSKQERSLGLTASISLLKLCTTHRT